MSDEYRVVAPEPGACGVAVPTPVVHPPWCDADLCNVDERGGGSHNSKALKFRARPPSPLGIALSLMQSEPAPGYPHCGTPMVTVTFVDTDDGFDFGTITMDLETAGCLGRALLSGHQDHNTSEV
jgi:hypothetical protein